MKSARPTVIAATTSDTSARWRRRKKRYASIVRRESMRALASGSGRGLAARGKDDPILLDAGGEPVAADDEPFGATGQARAAHPDELLLTRQLPAGPRLSAGRRGEHHARVPDHDAVPAGDLHGVEPRVLERLEESELLDRARLDGAALHVPRPRAVPRAQHEAVDADHPALLGVREAHPEERLLGADGTLRPRRAAVLRDEERAVLSRHEPVLGIGEADVVEHDVVRERPVLPRLPAVVGDGHRAPVTDRPCGPRVEGAHLEERLLHRDRARLLRPRRARVRGMEDEARFADHPAVTTPREVDAEERTLRAALARLPRLAAVGGVIDGSEIADRPGLARIQRLDVVEVVAEGDRRRGPRHDPGREREPHERGPARPPAARSPGARHR